MIESIWFVLLCVAQCSAECGAGSQQRSVVCLMKADEGFTIMPPYECSSLDRPLSQQSCNLKACGAKWYHTDWSAVSKIWNPRPICCSDAIKQGILPLWLPLTDLMTKKVVPYQLIQRLQIHVLDLLFFKETLLKLLLKSWQLVKSFSCTPNTSIHCWPLALTATCQHFCDFLDSMCFLKLPYRLLFTGLSSNLSWTSRTPWGN